MAGDASAEEAAWRDLIARFSTATAEDTQAPPWPAREDLPAPPAAATPGDPVMGPLCRPGSAWVPGGAGTPETLADDDRAPGPGEAAGPALDTPAGGTVPGPDATPGRGAGRAPGTGADSGTFPPQAAARARIVRPAGPQPGGYSDDHYVPPPPPPLPSLDPVAKGAWAALFGGPGYLLLAVMVGWPVPGWAAFCAVAAFVGGFATLVVRMGDQPPRDSGPDDGAVV